MKRTPLALALTLTLLFSAMAGTSFLNVAGAIETCSAPIANLHVSAVGSAVFDNNAETSNTELSATTLWNFTVANSTINTVSLRWWEPKVANGIAYLSNTETYIIPDEPRLYPSGISLPHTLGTTYAINMSSGEELWNVTGTGSFRSLTIIDDVAYMSTSDSTVRNGQSAGANVYALDAVNGTQKWSHHFNGDSRWSKINDNMVYVYFLAPSSPSYVCAVNMNNGSELWRWKTDDNDLLSFATVGDGAIYFGTYDNKDNHYYAVNATNGTELWRIPIEGKVTGISSVDDDVVYFNSDKTSYALNTQNGSKIQKFTDVGSYRFLLIDGGIAYVSSNATLYGFDDSNGNKIWNYSFNEMSFWIFGSKDDVVYLNTLNGTVTALNAANGSQLWRYNTGGNTSSNISDGVVYYVLGNTLHALDASNGNSLWNYTRNDQSFLTVTNGTAFFAAGNTVYALNVPLVPHSSPTPTPEPQQDAFLTTLAALAAGASAAIVGLGLLLYFKKRKR